MVHTRPGLIREQMQVQMVDGGGSMKLRHSDPLFLARVDSWWAELLPKLKRFLHVNGGNVLMVQVSSCEISHDSCCGGAQWSAAPASQTARQP